MIFLSNLQKVVGKFIFQTQHLLENNNKKGNRKEKETRKKEKKYTQTISFH